MIIKKKDRNWFEDSARKLHKAAAQHLRKKTKKKNKKRRAEKRTLRPKNYFAYIKSSQWRQRTRAYYALHGNACAVCADTKTVQLHHKTYERLGEEMDADLIPLCDAHHKAFHSTIGGSKKNMVLETDAFVQGERHDNEAHRLLSTLC